MCRKVGEVVRALCLLKLKVCGCRGMVSDWEIWADDWLSAITCRTSPGARVADEEIGVDWQCCARAIYCDWAIFVRLGRATWAIIGKCGRTGCDQSFNAIDKNDIFSNSISICLLDDKLKRIKCWCLVKHFKNYAKKRRLLQARFYVRKPIMLH